MVGLKSYTKSFLENVTKFVKVINQMQKTTGMEIMSIEKDPFSKTFMDLIMTHDAKKKVMEYSFIKMILIHMEITKCITAITSFYNYNKTYRKMVRYVLVLEMQGPRLDSVDRKYKSGLSVT